MGFFTERKNRKYIPIILSMELVIFVFLLSYFTLINLRDFGRSAFGLVAILAFFFLFLGIILIILTLKQKIKGRLKILLLLTGLSAICPLIFSILHNLFYALAVVFQDITLLRYLMEFLHGFSFLISLIGGPIGFLIGIIGSIMLLFKEKKS
ncbi:MAG: hypothetical protein GF368_02755 [Candidatus Aenigmarchaeota archaeon]|nr:hypothetical protein [Candidatus Aenigmarchaeota archaeon]